MRFTDFPADKRKQIIDTLKHWLESTGGNVSLAGRITNRLMNVEFNTGEYKEISGIYTNGRNNHAL